MLKMLIQASSLIIDRSTKGSTVYSTVLAATQVFLERMPPLQKVYGSSPTRCPD